ncbi:MAG: aromatic acid/H+ symport family MFS transporter [Dermatophilus congolensis]|nr:aromatic acid/H+ symport family MFS transporter [Dermatophilus congolensis]
MTTKQVMAVLVAWLFVVFDGYDLIVYGTVTGALMQEWNLTPGQAGTIGSSAFVGMMIGALVAGRVSDAIGRRKTILACGVILSVFTGLCAVATGPWMFGILRLLAGLGLGGLVPSANALAADVVPVRWRASVATLMMSGVPIGGSAAALIGIPVIPAMGWRPMFAFAIIALVVLIPLGLIFFPKDKMGPVDRTANPNVAKHEGYGALLRPPYRGIGILFAVATVVTLMAWYGLGTWLPKLMVEDGYSFENALLFALALNMGAVIGSVVTAWAGDKVGTIPTAVAAAGLAGIALLVLLLKPPIAVVYVILILAGVGTHGTQCLIIAAIATYFPDNLRGTALGFGLGMGRIGAVAAPQLGGLLLGWGLGVGSNYIMFGGAALLAAIILAGIWANYGVTYDSDKRGRVEAMEDEAVM